MHEVRSELQGFNVRVDQVERRMEGMETEVRLVREENSQSTHRLIDAFGKIMAPLIDRVLTREQRINCL
jgi:outer membrane murein-binding lipoprotein Lpp